MDPLRSIPAGNTRRSRIEETKSTVPLTCTASTNGQTMNTKGTRWRFLQLELRALSHRQRHVPPGSGSCPDRKATAGWHSIDAPSETILPCETAGDASDGIGQDGVLAWWLRFMLGRVARRGCPPISTNFGHAAFRGFGQGSCTETSIERRDAGRPGRNSRLSTKLCRDQKERTPGVQDKFTAPSRVRLP